LHCHAIHTSGNRAHRMNKRVLIVAPFFAPQSHAAVFRAHKLAKYLPRFGWKPVVLTVDTNYIHNEDRGLIADLPPDVEVHRARYVEPTLRGLRMALGGTDRRFTTLKDTIMSECSGGGNGSKLGLLDQTYGYLLSRWGQVPDAHWTWVGPAVRLAQRLVREQQIPIVYTTCLPYSANVIGMHLQEAGCRWVADFRDPAGYTSRLTSGYETVAARQRHITRETLQKADAVTALSSSYGLIFRDLFPEVGRDVLFIPTGLDEDVATPDLSTTARPWPYLLFSGEFLSEYDNSFFQVFSLVSQVERVRRSGIKLVVIGHKIINIKQLEERLRSYGLEQRVEFIDHMPQHELYGWILGAQACLLIPGQAMWWSNFAKLVDYVALRKPVIAMVPNPSEARSVLTQAGLGVFLDGTQEAQVTTLVGFLSGNLSLPAANDEVCRRYTATSQVQAFVNVFEQMLEVR
jgi:glycosyltransferase involved in cell wall biosynthesis